MQVVEAGSVTQRATRGRKGKDKQEAIIELGAVRDRIEHLVSLKRSCESANEDYGAAIKSVSEKAGIQASVLRKYVDAKCGENFEDRKRDAYQLNLVFDEVGG